MIFSLIFGQNLSNMSLSANMQMPDSHPVFHRDIATRTLVKGRVGRTILRVLSGFCDSGASVLLALLLFVGSGINRTNITERSQQ